eukprot:TRINITY_DN6147_c0_g1_i1.p1 TRINITY_DN6147_c0_g1~~TRINITY_DN6147_c0_g1_i1.p1  ORF type:complete len:429 (+),score=123.69 TRINITY_DN6147_c0_g1_i1:146-1432(+)
MAGLPSAPAITRVVVERNQHLAEVTVFIRGGLETPLRGPPRRNRQEALKDCIELRKVAVKCTDDPSLFKLRQRKKELDETTWTMKDLGGRQLDGAEGAPPGFSIPRTSQVLLNGRPVSAVTSVGGGAGGAAAAEAAAAMLNRTAAMHRQSMADKKAAEPAKFKGIVKGTQASSESIVEVAGVEEAMPGASASKLKVALQQLFKKYGHVAEVRTDGEIDGQAIASVRFSNAKAAEAAMVAAAQGYLPFAESELRVRQPGAKEHHLGAVWRKFPPARRAPATSGQPSKKKLRPNERFAQKLPGRAGDEPDESELFWEAQKGSRGVAAEPPPNTIPPPEPEPVAVVPDRPVAATLGPDASAEDQEVSKGQQDVSKEMQAIIELPFSQQKKALKTLRRTWHPDKNPERLEVSTRVFQFIQDHDEWLTHHGLA